MPATSGDVIVGEEDQSVLDKEDAQPTFKKAEPPLYRVLLLNDDFTPMEFVVSVLKQVFSMEKEQAITTMLKVHHEGRATCGVFPRDIAATKVNQVMKLARAEEHPLRCVIEENQ